MQKTAFYLFLGFSFFANAAQAFTSDARVDIVGFGLGSCADGHQVQDAKASQLSCKDDEAYINNQGRLVKNGKVVFDRRPDSFKLDSRGNLYWISSGTVYSEAAGPMERGAYEVTDYLVAHGHVAYTNKSGNVYRDGKRLESGSSRVNRKDLLISINGDAVYKNQSGDLYLNGQKQNPTSDRALQVLLDDRGQVFWISKNGRVFRGRDVAYEGIDRALSIRLGPNGDPAILTGGSGDNLFYKGKRMNSGGARVESLQFTGSGDLIYMDDLGRRWKNGAQSK